MTVFRVRHRARTVGHSVSRRTGPGRYSGKGRHGHACVGLLEDGRGLAGTLRGVFGPGCRSISTGETVETREIGGRIATNRAGAAERLNMPLNTVNVYSSRAQRPKTGWPEPLPARVDGQDWFALDDLDAYAESRKAMPRAPVAHGDPDELIGVAEFARIRGVSRDTFKRYVEDSLSAWERGEDGYLLQPDQIEPARARGNTYQWRRSRAVAWTLPPARRTGGRKPGPRPQVADLRQVLDEPGTDERPTVRELARALTARLGTEVSSQTVRRLLRQMRDQGDLSSSEDGAPADCP